MSTHEDRQLDFVISVLDRLAKEFRVRECDLEEEPVADGSAELVDGGRSKLSYL